MNICCEYFDQLSSPTFNDDIRTTPNVLARAVRLAKREKPKVTSSRPLPAPCIFFRWNIISHLTVPSEESTTSLFILSLIESMLLDICF